MTWKLYDLSLEQLRLDGGTQPRVRLDADWVAHLRDIAEHEKDEGAPQLPPPRAFFDGSDYWLAEGFHRYFGRKKAGQKRTAVLVTAGTREDAILYAVGTNADHGMPRKPEDLRHAVRMLLLNPEWRKWSDREIARRCKTRTIYIVADERRKLREDEVKTASRQAAEKDKPAPAPVKEEPPDDSHCSIVTVTETEEPEPETNRVTYTTRHGTVGTMDVTALKAQRVRLVEVETDKVLLASLDRKIPRSRRKYALQCIRRGITEDQAVEDFRKEYRSIPVKK